MTDDTRQSSLLQRAPTFRLPGPPATVLALTWFGAAAFVMASHLWWGLAMAALPFFLLAIADAGPLAKLNLRVLAAVAAGMLVLAALGSGFAQARQDARPLPISARSATAQVNAQSNEAATAASAEAATSTSAEAATAASAEAATATSAEAATAASAEAATAASTATPATPVEGAGFVASRQGEVYHLPGCASAKRIKPENLAAYATLDEAEAKGLRPCKKCKPNETTGGSPAHNDTKTTGGTP